MRLKLIIICIAVMFSAQAFAQKASVKINLIHGATATPNLAVDFKLGKRTSFEIYGAWNPWTFSGNKKIKHSLVQPEFRWWFCETFSGGFLGVHVHGGEFNVGNIDMPFDLWPTLKDNRCQGNYYGAGISVGRQWMIGKRWSMEAVIGGGYVRADYDRYECVKCSPKLESGSSHYVGPTKIALSFAYFLW